MDSDVIDGMSDDDIAELVGDLIGDYDVGDVEVGRRRRRRHGGSPTVPKVDIHALAKRMGYRLVRNGSVPGETVGNQIQPSNQRRQLIAFTDQLALIGGQAWQLLGRVQKGIQVETLNIECTFANSGNDASPFAIVTDVKVGVKSQFATVGNIPLSIFAASAWGKMMVLDAAKTGNDFSVIGSIRPVIPSPINIAMGGIGLSAE